MVDVGSDGKVDLAPIALDVSIEQGDVGLLDEAALELARQVSVGIGIEGEDDEARGVHVETMDDEGAGRPRKGLADPGGEVGPLDLARDAEQARGLVDDDEAGRLVHDVEGFTHTLRA